MSRQILPWVLAVSVACEGATAPPRAQSPRLVTCVAPVVLLTERIGAGGEPRFNWSPPCGATYLEVSTPDHQTSFWIIQGDTGKIAPGVTYGVAPPDYSARYGPLPLVSGARYVVRLGVMIDENSYAVVGEGAFQR